MPRSYVDVLNGDFGDAKESPAGQSLSFIFGSALSPVEDHDESEQRRIAVYPCEAAPERFDAAQGLMCVLAWGLNGLDGVTAIPVLLRDPREPAEKRSFAPDEFGAEGLGDDTVVTAELKEAGGQLVFSLHATTDLDDTEDWAVDIPADGFAELLNGLLSSIVPVGKWLAISEEEADVLAPPQLPPSVDGSRVEAWLEAVFEWHREAITRAVQEQPYLFAGASLRSMTADLGGGLSGLIIQGASLFTTWFVRLDLSEFVGACQTLPDWFAAAPAIARVLVVGGAVRQAVEVLEAAAAERPEIAQNWLVLARILGAAQRPDLMLDVLQRGIEHHETSVRLLMAYGDLLGTFAEEMTPIPSSLFVEEPEEVTAANEAIAVYREVTRLAKGELRCRALVQLVAALARYIADETAIWPALEELAIADSGGIFTELAINTVAASDEIEKALNGLERASVLYPEVGQVWRNLAYVQYLNGDAELAKVSSSRALRYASSTRSRGEFELLSVYASGSDVESQLAELADKVQAGGELTERDLEFLEWIVGEAPHYAEGYLLLARAYLAEGEGETALEVLLDAEKNVGDDAGILSAIVDVLIESDEFELALEYVSKGLELFPRNVPLLARAAQVSALLGDGDTARSFLRRAHYIAPYHRELLRVTQEIADSDADPS